MTTLAAVIVRQRLLNQHLLRPFAGTAADLVAWMGAVQAQEYEHARWGIGLRLPEESRAEDIEKEIDAGAILRTHVLRPTWHFVTAPDLAWMLALTAPRVHARMATYDRQLGLDTKTMTRATGLIERAVGDGGCLTRAELGEILRRARVRITPIHLAHIAMYAELEGIICSGPRRDGASTYALVSSRTPQPVPMTRDESLGELARRYLQSHGPATIRDFVWWSGLTTPEATRATQIARASSLEWNGRRYWALDSDRHSPAGTRRAPVVHLLPIYDEYLVAYKDRDAVPHLLAAMVKNGRIAGYQHAVLIEGQIAGTWRPGPRGRTGVVDLEPARQLTRAERARLAAASKKYTRFDSMPRGRLARQRQAAVTRDRAIAGDRGRPR